MFKSPWPPEDSFLDGHRETRAADDFYPSAVRAAEPHDYRISTLSIAPVKSAATVARWVSKLPAFDPRLQLVAAGCVASVLGYNITSLGCDLAKLDPAPSPLMAANAEVVVTREPHELMLPRRSAGALPEALVSKPVLTNTFPRDLQPRTVRPSRARSAAGHRSNKPEPEAAVQLTAAVRPNSRQTALTEVDPEESRPIPLISAPLYAATDLPPRAALPAAPALDAEQVPDGWRSVAITPRPEASATHAFAQPNRHPGRASVALHNVEVHGSLPKSVVRHGLERLQPEFAQCHTFCDADDSACASGAWHTEAQVDEAGHSREPHVRGPAGTLPLANCLAKVASKLTVLAPDTGTVRVAWDIRFVR